MNASFHFFFFSWEHLMSLYNLNIVNFYDKSPAVVQHLSGLSSARHKPALRSWWCRPALTTERQSAQHICIRISPHLVSWKAKKVTRVWPSPVSWNNLILKTQQQYDNVEETRDCTKGNETLLLCQKFSILFLTISMNTLGITRLPVEIHFM